MNMYQLLCETQSNIMCQLIRETKMYLFLKRTDIHSNYVIRVNKKSLNLTIINYDEDGYKINMGRAVKLTKMD